MEKAQFETLIAALSSIAQPNWGAITALVLSAANLILIFFAYRQLKVHADLMRWSKASVQNEKLYELPDIRIELAVAHVLKNNEIKAYDPIPEAKCLTIYDDPECRIPVMFYLNQYEVVCVALSAGVVDVEVAYNLLSSRLNVIWHVWGPFIKFVRTHRQDDEIFWEIEKWAKQFTNEQKSRAASEKSRRDEAERQITAGKGMRRV